MRQILKSKQTHEMSNFYYDNYVSYLPNTVHKL